jgi:hypothetical protein
MLEVNTVLYSGITLLCESYFRKDIVVDSATVILPIWIVLTLATHIQISYLVIGTICIETAACLVGWWLMTDAGLS